jgi:hypothetical protein
MTSRLALFLLVIAPVVAVVAAFRLGTATGIDPRPKVHPGEIAGGDTPSLPLWERNSRSGHVDVR